MLRPLTAAACVLGAVTSAAAQQKDTQPPPQPPNAQPPRYEEQIEVVGVTPVHGIGLPTQKVPANVQVFTARDISAALSRDVPALLVERGASVQISEAQGGTFQPDLLFRGFAGSPLLGASEGLAVYQDGVRINDPFGDTVQWDSLLPAAIASINVMPGSNPMFGLNALGGAISIRTKDGFDFPGQRISVAAGSFGRRRIEADLGASAQSIAYFLAGSLEEEAGWREFSPSTMRRLFGSVAWRGSASALNVNVTAASNDLTGNGPAPVELLHAHRSAVFTHPDRTDNDVVLVTANGRRRESDQLVLEGVAYYRHVVTGTFNADAADQDADEVAGDIEPAGADSFDAVNNISDTRADSAGLTGQVTRTAPLWGRDNHLIAGAAFDGAGTDFGFATELADLTEERGTTRTGIFEDDAFVDLDSGVMTGSVFLTDTWSATPTLTLTGSARFNSTALRLRDRLGAALTGDHRFRRVNPAAGATYQARPWLNVYTSYTQSSRVPTPVELTCADPDDPCRLPNAFVSDPPLNQVVARTWEGGVRGTRGSGRWTLVAFRSAAAEDIIFVSSGARRGEGHFENVARTRRRGIEAHIEYDLMGRLSAFAAYTFQRATFGADLAIASRFHPEARDAEITVAEGDRLPGVPAHTAKLGFAVSVANRLSAGVNLRAQSGQFLRGDEANLLAPLPGFVVVNAQARYRLGGRLAVLVQMLNVLDAPFYTFGTLGAPSLPGEQTRDPRFYSPGAPRAASIGVELQL